MAIWDAGGSYAPPPQCQSTAAGELSGQPLTGEQEGHPYHSRHVPSTGGTIGRRWFRTMWCHSSAQAVHRPAQPGASPPDHPAGNGHCWDTRLTRRRSLRTFPRYAAGGSHPGTAVVQQGVATATHTPDGGYPTIVCLTSLVRHTPRAGTIPAPLQFSRASTPPSAHVGR